MELTADNVSKVLQECLYDRRPEDESKAIQVRGVISAFGFDPDRVEKQKKNIESMLNQLPAQFKAKSGGGWSFLNACMREDGEHWAEHRSIDELVCLGMAIKKLQFCAPREMWKVLPGGMPYFVILE